MLKTCILSLFQNKYKNHIVYVHNLSFFDGIFLMARSAFSSIDNLIVNPLIKDGKYFNIELILDDIKIIFRDSLLMLPLSLKKLSKSFAVEDKSIFPYDFVNDRDINDFDYIGKLPLFKYFTNTSQSEYVNYKKQFKNKN